MELTPKNSMGLTPTLLHETIVLKYPEQIKQDNLSSNRTFERYDFFLCAQQNSDPFLLFIANNFFLEKKAVFFALENSKVS
ncbi:hypothetical protein AsAng_0003640 [Aureispira anguillae]|uniref:Uncharacterized protein n=1 Tax=Aureispira anguillae TaxID=2864201 RepID=A0A915YAY7_9BACT|nr:hypothetical protein AsAng_0003640 [Aureispira anguillae]